jgi:two-component system response regulator HydG
MAGLILFVALFLAVFMKVYVRDIMQKESVEDAKALVAILAENIADAVLTGDFVEVDKRFVQVRRHNSEVSYIFLVKDGRVLHHTFAEGFPKRLIDIGHRSDDVDYVVVKAGEKTYYDYSSPVFGGRAGMLRLGMEERYDEGVIKETVKSLGAITAAVLLTAMGLSVLVSRRLLIPLGELTRSAMRIAEGEHTTQVPAETDDEVGMLATAFNKMSVAIQVRENRLKEINAELETVNLKLHDHIGQLAVTANELARAREDTAVVDTARTILHHTRQPLTYLTMAAEMLADELAAEKPRDMESIAIKLEVVREAGDRLSDLLRKFDNIHEYRVVRPDSTTRILDIDE